MDAFATYSDLEKLLNRTFTSEERIWVTDLLENASAYLREDVIGQQVYPQSTVTFTAYPASGYIQLPQHPVASVTSVKRDDIDVSYSLRDNYLTVDGDEAVTITYTFGCATAPEGLKRWACVLVSQVLTTLELKLGISVGGLSSVSIDDFRISFANGGAETGMQLSDRNIKSLRAQYGTMVHVGGMR